MQLQHLKKTLRHFTEGGGGLLGAFRIPRDTGVPSRETPFCIIDGGHKEIPGTVEDRTEGHWEYWEYWGYWGTLEAAP